MDAPDLRNRTDFVVSPHTLMGKEGEQLVVIAKATFLRPLRDPASPGGASGTGLVLAPRGARRPLRAADVPWGDPEKSSVRYPSDLFLRKPGTDVIVVAAAHAPGGRPVPAFDAGVRAGKLEKVIRVTGLRVWEANGAGLSAPRPGTGIEVRYDLAWGGSDFSDPSRPIVEPRNPVGLGIARDPAALTHRPAPMIEDPKDPLRAARSSNVPVGLGPIGRHWEPRRRYLGTYDAAWLEERAPLLPLDHDDRANLCASPGLSSPSPFTGGEAVALENLTPGGGSLTFRLPRIRLTMTVLLRDPGSDAPRGPAITETPHLDTVLIDTLDVPEGAAAVVELTWRAAFPHPRRLRDAQITVTEEEAA